ncbi:MAG: RNA polymerase sigma factor [Anaerolineae bacterium]
MPTDLTDAELVQACRDGQRWAWNALVERYQRLVYAVPLRAGLPAEEAEDVFQTVFLRLFEHLDRLREPQALGKWLITTTKREAWRALRRRQGEENPEGDGAGQVSWLMNAHPDERLWLDQVMAGEAMERIGERCRQLLWLLYYDSTRPSYEEISRQMKMPVGSIGPTRARCLEKLREVLRKMGMGT